MEWKIIKNFENYEISDTGVVRKRFGGKILKQQKNPRTGYMAVTLFYMDEEGISKRKYPTVHRLVAEAFLPNPNNYTDVNHKDYNKENNNVSNLEWCSRSDNLKHSYKHENRNKNREHIKNLAALNHEKMKKVIYQYSLSGELIAEYPSITDAAKATGIAMQNISAVARGERGTAGGYKWVREDIGALDFNQKRSYSTAVQQLDLNDNVIASFNSIADAARATGANASGISEVCRGNKKTAGNFKWKVIAPNG